MYNCTNSVQHRHSHTHSHRTDLTGHHGRPNNCNNLSLQLINLIYTNGMKQETFGKCKENLECSPTLTNNN